MATNRSTTGDDQWTITNPVTVRLDGLAGFDTVIWGDEPFSSFELTRNSAGEVKVDSVSSASSGGLHATLVNFERLVFESGKVVIELATYFDDNPVKGTTGNDRIEAGSGNVTIDALAGIDTVVLARARADYVLRSTEGGWQLDAVLGDQTVKLAQTERLQFVDGKLALDLGGSAGEVAKILGAVFGPASVANREYAGIGLQLKDAGMSYEALMSLALGAALGPGASHGAVVDLLYSNVVGVAPTADARAHFIGLLDSGQFTPATLGLLAADHELNLARIDLVGLQLAGLPYV